MIRMTVGLCAVAVWLAAVPVSQAAVKVPTPTSSKFKKSWNHKRFSHRLFNAVLKKYVKNARVRYNKLRKSKKGMRKLNEYLYRLSKTRVRKMKRNAQFAFWINAYNAVTIQGILKFLPKSKAAQKRFKVTGVKGFWKKYKYRVAGQWLSLNDIEHKKMRPKFKDARLHFVIVCAAHGCPNLRSRTYSASRLGRQLRKATITFLKDRRRGFRLDKGKKTVYLSKLFKWYKKDFYWKPFKHELDFVAKHLLNKKTAAYLRKNKGKLKIKYVHYSWKLNIRN